MTKSSYKKGVDKKRAARAYLIPLFQKYKKIIGLAGPSIKGYYDWCVENGFKDITSYEYDKRIAHAQRCSRIRNKLNMQIKTGAIQKAPVLKGVFYDLDLCDTIIKKVNGVEVNKELIKKFKNSPFILTLCYRKIGYTNTVKEFFKSLGISRPLVQSKINGRELGLGNNNIVEYKSPAGSFITLTYKDRCSPPMMCIAKIK